MWSVTWGTASTMPPPSMPPMWAFRWISAVDVAKEAADIVLLEKDLNVLVKGVGEGRTTFANTLKYVFMATSANFGNMFSMAGASLFLSFLPLLPKQILLTNLLTDFPEMTIATDRVDPEMVEKPRRWDIRFIRNFMITFGLLSSVFDYLTFGTLLVFPQGPTGSVQNRLVCRIGHFRLLDRAGHPHPPPFSQEQTRQGLNLAYAEYRGHSAFPLYSFGSHVRVPGPALLFFPLAGPHCGTVYFYRRSGKKESFIRRSVFEIDCEPVP